MVNSDSRGSDLTRYTVRSTGGRNEGRLPEPTSGSLAETGTHQRAAQVGHHRIFIALAPFSTRQTLCASRQRAAQHERSPPATPVISVVQAGLHRLLRAIPGRSRVCISPHRECFWRRRGSNRDNAGYAQPAARSTCYRPCAGSPCATRSGIDVPIAQQRGRKIRRGGR